MNKKTKIISFDIYDTLIQRVLPPEKIYLIIEKKLKIENFAKKRKMAEKYFSKKENPNIEEIYEIMEINPLVKKNAQQMEIDLEIKNAVINPIGKKYYEKFKDKYSIICVSDMYLSSKVLKKILYLNGYSNISDVFVSCEYKSSKRNKKLFKDVLNTKKIDASSICHIGDAKRSDYINAKIMGYNSIFIGRNNKNNYSKRLQKENYLEYLGFKIFGPVLYEYCLWINDNKIGNLKFVSREGEIIKRVYDTIFSTKEDMIYISRKSVISGISYKAIKKNKLKQLFQLISVQRNETIEGFLKRLGIKKLDNMDSKFLKEYISKENINKLYELINNNKEEILVGLKNGYDIFKQYINDEMNTNSTMVDVGWNGSMQNILIEYFNLENTKKNIKGLYLGSLNRTNKKGFLFEQKNYISNSILNYSGLLEVILMPCYGSIIGYKKCKNKIVPIEDNLEFSMESMNVIKNIQKGIMNYTISRKNIENDYQLYNTNELINTLNYLGIKPNQKDLDYLGNIDFYDNGENYKLINSKGNFKINFLESKWKIGFLKKKIKLNLPYCFILNLLRKRG